MGKMKKSLPHVSTTNKYNLGGLNYMIGNTVTISLLGSFDSRLFQSLGAAQSITGKTNKNLRVGGFGLSWGLLQNPFVLFKSEFLVSLKDEKASLSHDLRQLPSKEKKNGSDKGNLISYNEKCLQNIKLTHLKNEYPTLCKIHVLYLKCLVLS